MAVVEGDNEVRIESFCEDYDGSVDSPEWEVTVTLDQRGDWFPLLRKGRLNIEIDESAEERCLRGGPKISVE